MNITISKKNKARMIFYPTFIAMVIASVFWMKHMPGDNYTGSPPPLTKQQKQNKEIYLKQLQLHQFAESPHNFQHAKELEQAKLFIIKELESYGYQVNILEYGQQKFANLEIVIEPKKENKGTIVIGAHYDSEGEAPGANDNGSAVVILLDLAKRLKNINTDHKLRLVFFFFF